MSRYNPPSGYRLPRQPYSKFGYDGNLWLPASVGKIGAIMPGGSSAAVSINLGALFNTFAGLSTRAYFRSDIGVSGTSGTGKTNWTNLLGDYGNMAPEGTATNGIGSLVAGLNGFQAVEGDGATQTGIYVSPSEVAPATTNFHVYSVDMFLLAGVTTQYICSAANNVQIYIPGGQVAPSANCQLFDGSPGPVTTGVVINQWYRTRASFTGSANDQIRVGSHAPAPTAGGTATPGLNWSFAGAYNGTSRTRQRTLTRLHVQGPLATFLTACVAVDAAIQTMYTSAVEI